MTAATLAFRMHAARAVFTDNTATFGTQLDLIEETIERVPDLTFDLAKGLLDTVCKTVLLDLGQVVDLGWETPRLVKETINQLRLISHHYNASDEAERSLRKLTSGLSNIAQGLCELRNHHGMAAHGHDALSERLGDRQALLAAQAVDVAASYIYRCHREATQKQPGKRVYYEDHGDFNKAYDKDHEAVTVGEINFNASLVLFKLDPEAYRDALIEYREAGDEMAEEGQNEGD